MAHEVGNTPGKCRILICREEGFKEVKNYSIIKLHFYHKWNLTCNTCPYSQSILIYTLQTIYVVIFLRMRFTKKL